MSYSAPFTEWALPPDRPPEEYFQKAPVGHEFGQKCKPSILVVDDEPVIADTIADILNGSGFEAVAFYDGRKVIERTCKECPDVIISDVIMPHMNGIEMMVEIRKKCPATRVLLISGQTATVDLLKDARKQGHNFEILEKPLRPEILLKKLRQ